MADLNNPFELPPIPAEPKSPARSDSAFHTARMLLRRSPFGSAFSNTVNKPLAAPAFSTVPSDSSASSQHEPIVSSIVLPPNEPVSPAQIKSPIVPAMLMHQPDKMSDTREETPTQPAPYPVHFGDGDEYAGKFPSNYDEDTVIPSFINKPTPFSSPYVEPKPCLEPTFETSGNESQASVQDRNETASVSSSDHPNVSEVNTAMSAENQPNSNSPSISDEYQSEFTPSPFHTPAESVVSLPGAEKQEDSGLTAGITGDPADLSADDSAYDTGLSEPAPGLTDEQGESVPSDKAGVDFNALRTSLMALQQQIRAAKIPVVIVFEGWDAAGKGTLLSKLIEGLDPRGYQVYPIHKLNETEDRYPTMRHYWVKMPAQGNISLFCSSWYREVSNACFENKSARRLLRQHYDEIVNMESQLVCDGVLIIKFFLHVSRKEQKRRLKVLDSKKITRWRITREDWEQNEQYEDYLRLYDAMIARTHYNGALWHVLRSDDSSACIKQVYDIVIDAFRTALKDREENLRTWDTPFLPHLESLPTVTFPQLETFDPEQVLTEPYKPTIDKAQKRLWKLQNELYRRKIPMVVCFEGWDAAGKGGAIRRLSSSLDPRGFDVVPISAPTPLELSHHYLWRFWNELPRDGHVAIFDRTWYGRVMVERIEGFCTNAQWNRAYEEINRFEAELAAHGTVICKFWLQIDNATQLTRFQERQNTADKQWKITDEDWRNRSKWPQYENAVNEMLQKTNTADAPWTVVEANNKQYARLKVLQTAIHAIEHRLESL